MIEAARVARQIKHVDGYLELGLPHRALEILDSNTWPCAEYTHCLLRGKALADLERYREALVPLERAAAIGPTKSQVYFALAWCYKRTGQLPRAIEAMRTAHRLEPREGLAKYNLACYLSLAGRADEAIRWLGRALVSDPKMRDMAAKESDFDPIRQHPQFEELIGQPSPVPDDVA